MSESLRVSVVRDGFGGGNDAMTYAALRRLNGWDVTYWRNPPLTPEESPGLPSAGYAGLHEPSEHADVVEPAELGHWWTRVLCEQHPRVYPVVWQNLPWVDTSEHTPVILKKAAGFIARSSMAAELLRLYGVGHDRIHVIHPAVDCERFCPVPPGEAATIATRDDLPVRILYAGRNTPEKGIGDLIAALLALPPAMRARCQLVLAGGAAAEISGLSVECLGPVPHHQMPGVYRSCDMFVYPTWPTQHWLEQWGLAVAEAMACGLPVVTTNVGAFQEILPPEQHATWMIPARDWCALRECLTSIIESASLRETLGRHNRLWVQSEFDGRKCAEGYRRAFGG